MNSSQLARDYVFVLLGIAGLLFVNGYSGPCSDVVHNYGGNLSASFAVYFLVRPTLARVVDSMPFENGAVRLLINLGRFNRLASATTTLLIVNLFEATNGFGVMANVYDPYDYLANTLGVVLAVSVGTLASRVLCFWACNTREIRWDASDKTSTS